MHHQKPSKKDRKKNWKKKSKNDQIKIDREEKWSGYFVATSGSVMDEMIKEYLAHHKRTEIS